MYVRTLVHAARGTARAAAAINRPVFYRMSSSAATPYRTVATPNAPSAIGPYSQAVVYNGTAYLSGCIPFDPKSMAVVEGGVEEQAKQALANLFAVAEAAGSDKSHILKVTVFLKDMNDFAKVNAIYEQVRAPLTQAFAPYKPARSAVEVARLPRDVLVEVEAVAAAK
ncbi:2-iminobutanoate/2-iminopropanoate deaminase [Malassezia obtusa]|uniref:2-iminobutanoate/2-iminopropanoate deaminase n=1 Tax=Malassezia obtusa TaxID=76774 RepID=A0AAF0IUH9_9BASI|nr:2-iminobutanoate/2-iminopropanoate deaminase [Malassezia obtusa]